MKNWPQMRALWWNQKNKSGSGEQGCHKTASQRLTSSSLEIDTRWILLETENREHGLPSPFVPKEDRILYQVTSEKPDWVSSTAVTVHSSFCLPGSRLGYLHSWPKPMGRSQDCDVSERPPGGRRTLLSSPHGLFYTVSMEPNSERQSWNRL